MPHLLFKVALFVDFTILLLVTVAGIQGLRAEGTKRYGWLAFGLASTISVAVLAAATAFTAVAVILYPASPHDTNQVVISPSSSGSPPAKKEIPKTRPTASHSEVAFSELLTSDKETPDFGLYSYLLLGNTPQNDEERARDLSAVMAISSFSKASDMRKRFDAESLNITYLPLRSGVPIRINPTDSDTGKALLKEYDFARARSYLDIIDPALRRGPYIVSALQPLTISNGRPANFLFQDLSSATPRVVTGWVYLFQTESANQNFSEPEDVQRFALGFRSDVDYIAHNIMPNMPSRLADLIGWHSDGASSK